MTGKESSFIQVVFRVLIAALLTSAGLSVLMGVVWMAVDPEDEDLAKAEATTLLVMVMFGAWLLTVLVIRAGRLLIIMTLSATGILCGTGLLVYAIWAEGYIAWQNFELLLNYAMTTLLISLALVHNGALSLPAAGGMVRVVKIVTMVCPWLFLACLLTVLWFEELFYFPVGGFFFVLPFMLISLLFTAVGTVVVPLATVGRLSWRKMPEGAMESRLTINMDCPQCGERHDFAAGAARCPDCRARLFIEVEEPHCECGYLLYRLTGEVCPECGRPVPAEQRWAAVDTGD